MKPAAFDYLQAATLDEALDLLHEAGGDARVIAGGQSLVPMLNMRLARPAVLVDIMRIDDLRKIEAEGNDIMIGAGVRQAQLEAWPDLSARLPLVAMALPWIGHVQTRARGTVCGSLAHADPSAELPLSLIALQGNLHLRTKRKRRTVAADDFFLGMMATELGEGEMIEAVSLPSRSEGTGYGFNEIGRRHGDFAITAVAAVVTERSASIAIAGVDDRPRRFDVPLPSDPGLDDALNEIAWDLNARDDIHASARYRRELVRRLGRRTIEEAAACLV
ncbi:FAD binding domain-containing protein [Mesorhizobium sp. YIM 152430]|uniref:FAD binding domain-containing protein n=1 Tax=Mesorhizobium sp. YIM 152430 TaxID=3031761 RepID=UPI0023DBD662|nr:FAD binding domain-containing protein [Mesorhizobium sp. YIM 152430]MDF1601803.1 FAD binding domain-containing protein [Mesorhizobium sp. YIM 152430]